MDNNFREINRDLKTTLVKRELYQLIFELLLEYIICSNSISWP